MKNKLMQLVGAIGLAVTIAIPAQAIPITGKVTFGGLLTLTGGSNFASTTGIDFGAARVISGSGDFSSVPAPFATSVAFTDFSFSSFPAGGVTSLWSFSSGGKSYSFDLKTLTVDKHDSGFLNLSGTGTLNITGFDATNTLWAFSTNSSSPNKTARLSFSADNTATVSVPEPSSVALLAAGLVGLGLTRRFSRK